MKPENMRKRIHAGIDNYCSFLQPESGRIQRILHAAEASGSKSKKKRISLGLVIAIALVLVSMAALAVSAANYFSGFAALENTYGEYGEWPRSAKVKLVGLMNQSGMLTAEENEMWNDAEKGDKELSAERILNKHFDGMTYVDTYNAMARELGPIEKWTDEERALYTTILQKFGKQSPDWPVYLMPTNKDLARDEAIQRAREAVLAVFSVNQDELDQMVVDAVFAIDNYNTVGATKDEPFWEVDFGYGYAYRVYMMRDGEMLGLMGPATQFYPWNCDIAEGASEAILSAQDITIEQAVAEACSALTEVKDVSQQALNAMDVTTKYIYCSFYCNGKEPVWIVSWSSCGEVKWNVLLGYDGSFIDAQTAGKLFDKVQRNYISLTDMWNEQCNELGMSKDFYNSAGKYYYAWTLEEKAAFSAAWVPIVAEYKARNPYLNEEGSGIWEWTRNINGLPDDRAISQNQAGDIALGAIEKQFGEKLCNKDIYVFYFITNPVKPEWRIASASKFVTIDAYSGKILSIESGISQGKIRTISDFLQE